MGLLSTGRRRVGLLAATAILVGLGLAVPAGVNLWTLSEESAANPPATSPAAGASGAAAVTRSCAGHPLHATRELRGMWITTVYNIDWPSKPGLEAEKVRAEYRGWLDLAQRLNFNAVFVHIRPSGDAFWPSPYAPWSEWLTGRRDGVSPGWDPLAFVISETHARNIEFHAWFNPYRGSQPGPQGAGPDINKLAPDHPLRKHPEWAVVYPVGVTGSRLLFDPGIPDARRFVEDSMLDAVARYDVDGVHFDDFFYPYPVEGQDFRDNASFKRYGGAFTKKADWRRDNVNQMVHEMSERIKALKPWVKFGISPFGIWRNSRTDAQGSATRGLQSYDDIYADTRLWIRKGWLDYIVPQIYWHIGFDVADYSVLVPWWSKVIEGTPVQLYIGQADYRVGEDGAWSNPTQLDRQLTFNDKYPVSGSVHFSAKSLRTNRLGSVSRYRTHHYATPALVPAMARLPANPPAAPAITAARRDAAGAVTLTWRPGGTAATGFAVYRADRAAAAGTPAELVATTRAGGKPDQVWVDTSATKGHAYTYCVTGLDRLWNAGGASAARVAAAS